MAKRTPEKAEEHRLYMREYNSRPEVVAHRAAYLKTYYRQRARRQQAAVALDVQHTVADALYAIASAIAALAPDKESD